jgi:NADH-quinone oxidoreductase subunit M
VLLAMTAFLVPGLLLFSWEEKLPEGRTHSGYFALLLATEATLVGVFTATDVFLFYVFFEAMLVPMYFLIGRFGGPRRQYAAVKFFLYSLFGGLIMLASLIGMYVVSRDQLGAGTFSWADLQRIAANVPESTQIWLFLGFFVAFAIKAPLVPFHTWLPDAGAEAPIGAGVVLVGVLDKVGTFGFLRYCLPLFPLASQRLAPLVLTLAVIGILYGALLAVGQQDMKRFVSYTSIAHFGFIALGVFSFSSQALAGSTLYMVNHGLSTGMLFVMVGVLVVRGGSRLVDDYGGVSKIAPVLAGCLLLAGLSSLALPGTNSFVSEFLVLVGSYPREPVYTVLATVGIVLAALYVLWFYQRTMQGPLRGAAVLAALERGPGAGGPGTMLDPVVAAKRAGSGFPDLTTREIAVLTPLIFMIMVLGFVPGPVLDVITPSVVATMNEVGLPDPVGGVVR